MKKPSKILALLLAVCLLASALSMPAAAQDAAPLADGEFYTFDIIGCEVFADDKRLGTVTNVLKTGSNDVFEVDGKLLIPALKSVVRSIDIAAKKILVDANAY